MCTLILRKFKKVLIVSCLVIYSLFFFNNSIAQNFDSTFQAGLHYETSLNEKLALVKFIDALKIKPLNLAALYKCSELCSRIGHRESNTNSRDKYFQSALSYATIAYNHYPNNDEANVAMSIALGRIALTKSGKDKISKVKQIKKYAENAVRLNPNNAKAWHIIGKWNYEVSNLSMIESAATNLFYGGLPAASLKASIEAYEKAKKINPYFCLNYLELAKAYYRNDERNKAISTLKLISAIAITTEDDIKIKKEAAELLRKWNR